MNVTINSSDMWDANAYALDDGKGINIDGPSFNVYVDVDTSIRLLAKIIELLPGFHWYESQLGVAEYRAQVFAMQAALKESVAKVMSETEYALTHEL